MLDADINKCPYFKDKKYCSIENMQCSMIGLDEQKPKEKYVREPRWYEQYYKNNSRQMV